MSFLADSQRSLILLCLSGFEGECASEITDVAALAGVYGYPKLQKDSGYVEFVLQSQKDALAVFNQTRFRDLIFIRQWFMAVPLLQGLPKDDRVTPLVQAASQLPVGNELIVEALDTTDGRELQTFAKKFASALIPALRREGLLLNKKERSDWKLHLLPLSGTDIWLGVSPRRNSSPHVMGIHRLKFPKEAPSRSTLKLEEAWHWFLRPNEREELLRPGMSSADLGAAPGGWTWQLVNVGLFVAAVDNGPMSPALMETGQVEHLTEDAFKYQPPKTLDWMVCDIVDKPLRTTSMVIDWAVNDWCRQTIFNLKLQMKQR